MKEPLELIRLDPLLADYQQALEQRAKKYEQTRRKLVCGGQSLCDFANAHLYFGFHSTAQGWVFREWAPGARAIYLMGEFNNWNRRSHPLSAVGEGVWELQQSGKLPHGSRVRLEIHTAQEVFERIPAYIRRAVQNPETFAFDGQIWQPEHPYDWGDGQYRRKEEPLLVYECHVGMAGEEGRVATYDEFRLNVLPRVHALGYNALQLMAIQEHPYYASFGYQVSNFFAPSSRFGTPEELKHLIDQAHQMGIAVLLDVVHSHAAANEVEGLARFDGTQHQYFHTGARGTHPQWGTKLFDYGKPAVLHFLLSNLKFWLEEYHFDGFRFDGITSMLYRDHGLGAAFTQYDLYFSENTDEDALCYLQLASQLCREVKPGSILIAEDMSAMPGMCVARSAGGIGFDYRLSMGMPDYWVKTLRALPDEQWDLGQLWHELTQRRPGEKVMGYCESHDQALVGDKTIMFWLADAAMYWHMEKSSNSAEIDRAIALHKMIRLITCLCAGEGYLNFMGNEFGHPEWIDFPRQGNANSYHYARRQWSLADDERLRYGFLQEFDREMIGLARTSNILAERPKLLLHNEQAKVLVFEKGGHLCAFNFHPVQDFSTALMIHADGLEERLDTNEPRFGAAPGAKNAPIQYDGGTAKLRLYRRSAMVWAVRRAQDEPRPMHRLQENGKKEPPCPQGLHGV